MGYCGYYFSTLLHCRDEENIGESCRTTPEKLISVGGGVGWRFKDDKKRSSIKWFLGLGMVLH